MSERTKSDPTEPKTSIRLVIQGTSGSENPEKAILPFVFGRRSLAAGRDVVVILSSDAVWLATPGYADSVHVHGYPSIAIMIHRFLEEGGKVLVTAESAMPRSLVQRSFVDEVALVAGAEVAELLGCSETLRF